MIGIARIAAAGLRGATPSVSSRRGLRGVLCRYAQTAAVQATDEGDEQTTEVTASEYRKQHSIKVSQTCADPYIRFEDCTFSDTLMRVLQAQGFPSPTPIQAQSWPIANDGKDIVSVAKTGSGKTFGFLIPAVEKILRKRQEEGLVRKGRFDVCQPSCVVLAPTRELAQQINQEAVKICTRVGINTAVLFGGASKSMQLNSLRRHPDVIVATPGRLNDFLDTSAGFPAALDMSKVTYTVLDEADRMLDMGFEPQIKSILDHCPPPGKRQTLMFTATWPKKVQSVAKEFTAADVEHVMIGNANEKLTASSTIKQIVHIMRDSDKLDKLQEILRDFQPQDKVMIFAGTKQMCDDIDWHLRRDGVRTAGAIHGNKTQSQRERILNEFRRGRGQVLVATDVAARGIDVPDVKAVIVFDFPTNTEDYIHRIGRTGRAGKEGLSHAFITEQSSSQTPELAQIMKDSGNEVSPELAAIVQAQKAPVWSQRTLERNNGPMRGNRGGHGDRFGGRRNNNYGGNRGGRYADHGDRYGGSDRYTGDRYGGNGANNRSRYGARSEQGNNQRYDAFGDNRRRSSSSRWEDDYY